MTEEVGPGGAGTHASVLGGEFVRIDRHGIGGFAFDTDGSRMPCAVSLVSSGDGSADLPTGSPDGPLTLRIHGELDLYTVPFVKGRISRAVEVLSARDLVLDFTYCDFVDSTGLALILSLRAHLEAAGGRVRVACLAPTMRRKLARTLPQTIFSDLPAGTSG